MPALLDRRGVTIRAGDDEVAAMRRAWAAQRYVLLPRFVGPELLAFVQRSVRDGAFGAYHHPASGHEQRLADTPGISLLDFLMNDPALLRLVERVSGAPPLGMFLGRIYRLTPGTDEGHDWHGDHAFGREVGVSINLSERTFTGGVLQLREAASGRPVGEIANTGPGDCVLFQLSDDIEHRVLPVTGASPRVAFAGWFFSGPGLKARLDALSDSTD